MYVCMYVCMYVGHEVYSAKWLNFAQGKVAIVPCGKEWLQCVTASVNRLGGAAGIYKIPILAFTVQSVNIWRAQFTELRTSLTSAM